MLVGGVVGAIVGAVVGHDWKRIVLDVVGMAITMTVIWPITMENKRVPIPDWLWLEPDKSDKNHKPR